MKLKVLRNIIDVEKGMVRVVGSFFHFDGPAAQQLVNDGHAEIVPENEAKELTPEEKAKKEEEARLEVEAQQKAQEEEAKKAQEEQERLNEQKAQQDLLIAEAQQYGIDVSNLTNEQITEKINEIKAADTQQNAGNPGEQDANPQMPANNQNQ